MKEFLAGVSEK